MTEYQPDEAYARRLDAEDPLRSYRDRFHIPGDITQQPVTYFCGNSLGLQPKSVRAAIDQELTDWAELGVDGHFEAKTPWYSYHEAFRESGARLVGAKPGEVVMMNSLTVNLHLMMVSFYQPTPERYKILIDGPTFPSDTYAVKTQIVHHGYDPADALIVATPPVWHRFPTGESSNSPVENRCHTNPSHTNPSHTNPSHTNPSHTNPSHTNPSHTNPSHTNPSHTNPSHTDPSRTDPSHTEQGHTERAEEIEAILDREGEQIALVMCAGVNFFTGRVMDMAGIVAAARARGCRVGFDLAHAAGNIPLHLHDWGSDFAVWCHYKYLNSGPGAVAGCFVHERHADRADLPRFAGWWGNDPKTRFQMQLIPEFVPQSGAAGWQVSNPPIMALAPLRASLAMFDEAGMPALRAKSELLTGYLQYLIDRQPGERLDVITPRDPDARGCQLSILVRNDAKPAIHNLRAHHIVVDFREPNVIRVAPTPLYNTFHEVWRFAQVLGERSATGGPPL